MRRPTRSCARSSCASAASTRSSCGSQTPRRCPTAPRPTTAGSFLEHWAALAEIMATFEIILLQEVPGNAKKREEAVTIFHELLSRATEKGKSWSYVHSIPAGVGGLAPASGQTDVHAAFVKQGLDIEACTTWTHAEIEPRRGHPRPTTGERAAHPRQSRGRQPPALRGDERAPAAHEPPAGPRPAAAGAAEGLRRGCAAATRLASTASRRRRGRARARRRACVLHVIAGDFNVYPGATTPPEACDGTTPDPREAKQTYGLSAAGFVATVGAPRLRRGSRITTTSWWITTPTPATCATRACCGWRCSTRTPAPTRKRASPITTP